MKPNADQVFHAIVCANREAEQKEKVAREDQFNRSDTERKALTDLALLAYNNLLDEMKNAEKKAIDALARYKFWMFGYWAAQWVLMNRISGLKKPNPFKELVLKAREIGNVNLPHKGWKPDGSTND